VDLSLDVLVEVTLQCFGILKEFAVRLTEILDVLVAVDSKIVMSS
jgi:hypothetical protein